MVAWYDMVKDVGTLTEEAVKSAGPLAEKQEE